MHSHAFAPLLFLLALFFTFELSEKEGKTDTSLHPREAFAALGLGPEARLKTC